MPSLRKRAYEEVGGGKPQSPGKASKEAAKEPSMLQQIRNMWQFANLYQWIMLFGKAVKMEHDYDIEVGAL